MGPSTDEQPAQPASTERTLWDRIRIALSGFLLWLIIRLLCATLRIRVDGRELLDAAARDGKGALMMSWHGSTMAPVFWLRRRRPYGMISLSRDGQIEATAFRLLGWRIIRGSSKRGATVALLGAVRCLKRGNSLALTPDGPTGPAREIKPGSLFVAKASGCPVFPVGVAASRCWRVKSWDSYIVPKPGAKVHVVFAEPLHFAHGTDDRAGERELARRIDHAHELAQERLGDS